MRPSTFTFLCAVGLLSLQCLLSNSALAQETDATAEAAPVTEAGNTSVDDLAAARAVRAQALIDSQAYQQNIDALESRPGAVGAELSEAYMGLGQALRTLEEHEAAAEAFGKALQALRIGYGLNDVGQLPVLQELRATNETLQNWEEVHAANHLIFHVARHNPEAGEELRVQSLLQLGKWIQKANSEQLLSESDASADRLSELYVSELQRIEELEDYQDKSVHLALLYLDLATNELGEAKRIYELPISAFASPMQGSRTTVTQQCFSFVDRATGAMRQVCNAPVEMPNLNYYLEPNALKSTEIRKHLGDVQENVLRAYNALQDEPARGERQNALLAEVQRLTTEYNAFVAMNQSRWK